MSIDPGTRPATGPLAATPQPVTYPVAPRRGLLSRLGGVCLATGPLVLVAGMATSPPQTGRSDAAYVASLADAPLQAALSANLLHYSWLLLMFGVLACIGLVPGRRGRAFTAVTAVAGAIGAFQISGLLLTDFYLIRLGNDQGYDVGAATLGGLGTSVDVWLVSAQVLAALVLPMTFLGLARARVLSWWVAPLPLLAFAAPVLGLPTAAVVAISVVGWTPAYLAARRLVLAA
jgi:hypothetical protein